MAVSRQTGQCLCGAVRFTLRPPFRDVIVCHCRQCARWTGWAVPATAVNLESLEFTAGENTLKWYAASEHAKRGFCGTCGSSLFWRPNDGSRVAVLAGSLDPPTGLRVAAHIFTADKSDYYEICDGAPTFDGSAGEAAGVPEVKQKP